MAELIVEPGTSVEVDPPGDAVEVQSPSWAFETTTPGWDFTVVSPSTTGNVASPASDVDVLLLPGPAGPRGVEGPEGPTGPAGEGVEQLFAFPAPATVWVCDHTLNRDPVDVLTVDTNGEELHGDVVFVSSSRVEVRWYYPTAGVARIST